jgi:hypothetical protein
MELILNELSFDGSAIDLDTARCWMEELGRTINAATIRGAERILRTHRDFWSIKMTSNYSISDWSNDQSVDRDIKRFILSLAGKSPFIEDLVKDVELKVRMSTEIKIGHREANGLRLAELRNDPVVGVMSEEWRQNPLIISVDRLNSDGILKHEDSKVRNWHHSSEVERDRNWIRDRLADEVNSGEDLWNKRNLFLQKVEFVPNAEKNLRGLSGNETAFRHVVNHLLELNLQASAWNNGPFMNKHFIYKYSEESKSTIQQFGEHRSFECRDGVIRVFSKHTKIGPGAWRIHFLEDANNRRVVVGYIGPHLPTAGDPT